MVLQVLQLEHGLNRQSADAGTRLRILLPGAGRRRQGDGEVRDSTSRAASDRFRQPRLIGVFWDVETPILMC